MATTTARQSWWMRLGWRGQKRRLARPILVASRDLPPVDAETGLTLPRSPRPLSDEELVFANRAATRTAPNPAAPVTFYGSDLRLMLERFERACDRKEAVEQSMQARETLETRMAELRAGPRPALRLVPDMREAEPVEKPGLESEGAVEMALGQALDTLRRLTDRPRAVLVTNPRR